jgi:hypothetical protein
MIDHKRKDYQMIFVQCEDHYYAAKSWKALVRKMWHMSFDEAVSKEKFMFNVKERINELYHQHIERLAASVKEINYEKFVKALEELGVVKLYRCPECMNYITRKQCMVGLDTCPFKCDCEKMKIKRPSEEKPK